MLINESTSEDDQVKIRDVVKIRGQINDEALHELGARHMNKLMQSYKEKGSLDKIDMYLLEGIYRNAPDEIIVDDEA